jgi:hypothetical protein
MLCVEFTGLSVRYAPRAQKSGALPAKRLFLHSAAICGSFATTAANVGGGCLNQLSLRAVSALPLQLKQRLEELGQGGLGEEVDAQVIAAMGTG